MLYQEKPDGFCPDIEAVGCLVIVDNEILMLQRPLDHSLYPNLWGFPSGKIEKEEVPLRAIIRELWQETGIKANGIRFLGKVYIVFPQLSFPYHIFRLDLLGKPEIEINPDEHVGAKFVNPQDIIEFPHKYIGDTDACIKQFYR
ncbi:MAG TPA: NUDIX hydrolase [Candidatus Moranbacteria bacterium]|nr:NUDIX hydrolase [Candidatus Moranbacteria bacterium]